jgi:uncharacterized protein (TIGR03437 family)
MAREIRFRLGCFLALLPLATRLTAAQIVSFVPQPQVSTGAKPDSLAIGDFTGDGIPDVVVADGGTTTLNVLRGLGNGFFAALAPVTVGQGPLAIAAADFNRDGKLDLAVANFGSNTVSVLLGNGNGTFRALPTLAVTGPSAIAVADFNGDGKLDLAVAATNSNDVLIFLGNGAGEFQPFSTVAAGNRPVSIVAADFNNDGKLDLAVANLISNDVSIFLGNGNGTFQGARNFPAGQLPAYIALGDFNGDGGIDIAVANRTGFSSGTISLLLGLPNVTFQSPRTFTSGPNPTFLVAGDFNLDGRLDLAVANTGSNSISIFLGLGNGTFLSPQDFTVGSSPTWIGVVDLNADGKPDLLVANSASNSLSVLINQTAVAVKPVIGSTVNAGSMAGGAVAPGEIVTIFGSSLGPATPAGLQLGASGAVATTLSDVQVLFDGTPAPLVYVSSGQVSAVIPLRVDGRSTTDLVVSNGGQTSSTSTLAVSGSAPGVFTMDSSGSGAGAILNQDGTLNSSVNPASPGSVVVLFLTGAGETDPPGTEGMLSTDVLATLALPVSVAIGGEPAQVIYAGSVPGLIAGVAQVNVVVPEGVSLGEVPVIVRIGNVTSQSGVTLSVQ